ncbi:MAG: hypothetical protein V4598_11975 [Bdellovibrionota bacterium]
MSPLLGLFLLLASLSVFASPAEEREESRIPIMDTVDDFFGQRVNHVANDFDSFFATERADDELGRSRLRIRGNYTVEERSLPNDDIQIRFNLRLPKLESRFKYDPDDKKEKKKNKKLSKEELQKKEEDYLSRHRVDERLLFNADANVNASIHPSITFRARLRKSKETGAVIHRFVQEGTWISTRDGFRQRTTLNSDYSFDPALLLRFVNNVDWRISNKDFNTNHGPSLLHRLSDWDAMSYSLSMSTTVEDGVWYVSSYSLSPNYRRNLYREILYIDITPGISFPKQWSFRRTPFLFVGIEMLFGAN